MIMLHAIMPVNWPGWEDAVPSYTLVTLVRADVLEFYITHVGNYITASSFVENHFLRATFILQIKVRVYP